MEHEEPPCPLCGGPIPRDMCGPIAGRPAWFRKGEKVPTPEAQGVEGEYHWICDDCVRRFQGSPPS